MDELYKGFFPNISNVATKKTSDRDDLYNCIAWAFKDARRHWWPNKKRSYWPFDATGMSDMEAFEQWFSLDGWEETDNSDFEENVEKIALFILDGCPTHAARQLTDGVWTSKLGPDIDLWHNPSDLDGPVYGSIGRFYKKTISPTS